MEKKILKVPNFTQVSTIWLMDQLDGESDCEYLLLQNLFRIWKDSSCYVVSLYIEEYHTGVEYAPAAHRYMTASDLKAFCRKRMFREESKTDYQLLTAIYNALDSILASNGSSDEVFFEHPILFKAQNTGILYDIQCGNAQYGETELYAISGVKFSPYRDFRRMLKGF